MSLGRNRGYDFSLSELISMALRKDGLKAAAEAIETGNPDALPKVNQESVKYVGRILSEEVQKQFSSSERPAVELILNSVDAKPDNYKVPYEIDVDWETHKDEHGETYDFLSISDNGVGMGLYDVLTDLAIPFSTEKADRKYIGQFGVGFLSSLQWALDEDESVTITTSDGKKRGFIGLGKPLAWRTRFYGTDGTIQGLRCSIEPVKRSKRGTTVEVLTEEDSMGEIKSYVKKTLGFFDPETAVINFNEDPINTKFGGRRYKVALSGGKEEDMRIQIRPSLKKKHKLRLYSQGVLVNSRDIGKADVRIDLPSCVDLTQGRDEFIQDDNYDRVMELFWEFIPEYLRSENFNKFNLRDMRTVLPWVARHMDCEIENQEELKKVLGLDSLYICKSLGDYLKLRNFFGLGIEDTIYNPVDDICEEKWDIPVFEPEMVGSLFKNPKNFTVDYGSGEMDVIAVELPPKYGGLSPFLEFNGEVYYNTGHPLVVGNGLAAKYTLVGDFQRLNGISEEEIEDNILGY